MRLNKILLLVILATSSTACAGHPFEELEQSERIFVRNTLAVLTNYYAEPNRSSQMPQQIERLVGLLAGSSERLRADIVTQEMINAAEFQQQVRDSLADDQVLGVVFAEILVACHRDVLLEYQSIDVPEMGPTVKMLRPPEGYPFAVDPNSIDDERIRAEYEPRYQDAQDRQEKINAKAEALHNLRATTKLLRNLFQMIDSELGIEEKAVLRGHLEELSENEIDILNVLQVSVLEP